MKCEKLIKTAAVVALILFIAGAVIGTLAVPVVLSMFYSVLAVPVCRLFACHPLCGALLHPLQLRGTHQ